MKSHGQTVAKWPWFKANGIPFWDKWIHHPLPIFMGIESDAHWAGTIRVLTHGQMEACDHGLVEVARSPQ